MCSPTSSNTARLGSVGADGSAAPVKPLVRGAKSATTWVRRTKRPPLSFLVASSHRRADDAGDYHEHNPYDADAIGLDIGLH